MDDEVEGTVLRMLPEYIDTVEEMSVKYGTLLLNLHDVFQEQLKYRAPGTFCPEPGPSESDRARGYRQRADGFSESMNQKGF